MRILVIAPDYPNAKDKHSYGFVHSRAKIYNKFGNLAKVFVPSQQELSTYLYEGVHVIRAPIKTIASFVDNVDPDVIAVHAPIGYWLTPLLNCKRPIVSWIHGIEAVLTAFHHYHFPLSLRANFSKTSSLLMDTIKCVSLRRFLLTFRAVVYPSQWMKKMAEKYTQMRHPTSFIVPNPVDIDVFKQTNHKGSSERCKSVSVRALEWKYGLDIAIRAFSNLKKVHLTIFGKGTLQGYLSNLARRCNSNVSFVSKGIEHQKLSSLYHRFGFFVAPSRTEAQGVAMCEAMACGLPVVATRVGGTPEFVQNGVNGLLVPAEDSSKLRKAISLLVSNPTLYEQLSENASRFIKDNLSHIKVYQEDLRILKLAT